MAEAPTVTIRELEGARRSVVLSDRAKPYRRVPFGSTLRHSQTWYAGNPQATIQVLGVTLDPTTMSGVWKSRFLPGAVTVEGFAEVTTAEELVEVFRELQRGGSLLEVVWGPETRRGILGDFSPEWIRVEDVEWSATFVWRDEGRSAPRAAARTLPTESLREAQIDTDATATLEPPEVEAAWSDRVFGALSTARTQVGQVFDAVRDAREQAAVPARAVGSAAAAVRGLRDTVAEVRQELSDLPVEYVTANDDLASTLRVEGYRRGLGRAFLRLGATSSRTARRLARERTPEAVVVDFVAAGTSLRRLSARYYGTPDEWERIARASGLPLRSVLEADALVTVPPRAPVVSRRSSP